MDVITEYVFGSAGDTVFDWELQDDAEDPGTFAKTAMTPTRFVAVLTPTTGTAVTLDTDTAAITLETSGAGFPTSGHFRWNDLKKILRCAWAPLVTNGTILAGRYAVELTAYDASLTLGVRWGRQQKKTVVFEA